MGEMKSGMFQILSIKEYPENATSVEMIVAPVTQFL